MRGARGESSLEAPVSMEARGWATLGHRSSKGQAGLVLAVGSPRPIAPLPRKRAGTGPLLVSWTTGFARPGSIGNPGPAGYRGSSGGMRVDEWNRDVLVTILALLTESIPRPDLAYTLADWNKDRTQSLPRTLAAQGVFDGERLRELERLASSHLDRYNNDLRLCLEAWIAQGMTLEVLTEMDEGSVRSVLERTIAEDPSIAATQGSPDSGQTLAADSAGPPGPPEPPRLAPGDRFVPIRAHARGGIGQVWVARDRELQREVALKVILPRFADREEQRGAVPDRGRDHGQARASRDRPGLQPGQGRRGPALLRHAVHPRREPLGGDPRIPPANAAGRRT